VHCEIGVGCRIYEDRPSACEGFRCLWLEAGKLNLLSDDEIPYRTHVVMGLIDNPETYPDSGKHPTLHWWVEVRYIKQVKRRYRWMIERFLEKGIPVIISYGDKREVHLPDHPAFEEVGRRMARGEFGTVLETREEET
jgi:hypothetical protein